MVCSMQHEGSMDATLRQELTEAREKILEQLDDIEFRATSKSIPRYFGPPDYREVYAQLKEELRQIEELLETDGDGDG